MNANVHEAVSNQAVDAKNGPKYLINIEGVDHPWDSPTITTEQIAQLGGWPASEGVVMIDKENNEVTLAPKQVIEIQPGMGFAKKVKFKRG